MNSPILITGAPRSGKTFIAEILQECGVFVGTSDKLLENRIISEKLIDPFFKFNGIETNQVTNLPDSTQLFMPANWKDWIHNRLTQDGLKDGQKWLYKSCNVALTWTIWNYHYPEAKYIIIRRSEKEIINSCVKTAYITGYDTEEGWKQMIYQYNSIFTDMVMAGLNCQVVWPDRMVTGDYSQIYKLLEWLGVEWNSSVLEKIDRKFTKIRKNG